MEKNFQSIKQQVIAQETNFYNNAFRDNATRVKRGYGWRYEPSKAVLQLFHKHIQKLITPEFRVLDAGCGDGRHTEHFASRGLQVVGVDFSAEAIKYCTNRFRTFENVKIIKADLTRRNILTSLGSFDLIIDWSVLDHIRKRYLPTYRKNLLSALKIGGYLIAAEFDSSLPDLFRKKDYKIVNGHYSKVYSLQSLIYIWHPLQLVDYRKKTLETDGKKIYFNTVIMKKV